MTAAGLARLYGLMRPGEKLRAVAVTVIGGRRTVRLVLDRDGARRVIVDEDEAGAALCQAAAACGLREAARALVHRLIVSRT